MYPADQYLTITGQDDVADDPTFIACGVTDKMNAMFQEICGSGREPFNYITVKRATYHECRVGWPTIGRHTA